MAVVEHCDTGVRVCSLRIRDALPSTEFITSSDILDTRISVSLSLDFTLKMDPKGVSHMAPRLSS